MTEYLMSKTGELGGLEFYDPFASPRRIVREFVCANLYGCAVRCLLSPLLTAKGLVYTGGQMKALRRGLAKYLRMVTRSRNIPQAT